MSQATNPGSKKEIAGWALYDIANQAYTTVVISFVYSAFFVNYIVPEGSAWKNSYWSLAIISSTLLAMLLSPLLGLKIDQGASKKQMLLWSTAVCALFTCGLYWVAPGQVWFGVLLLIVTNTSWMVGEFVISAFLPDIAHRKNMGVISGLGWGLGYIGGLVSMVLVSVIIINADPLNDLAAYVQQHQWSMIVISVYFVAFAIPTFLWLKDRRTEPTVESLQTQWYDSFNLARLRRQQPVLLQFFIAFVFYMAGVQTVIKFIGIFTASEVGMGPSELVQVFLATQLSALAGAIGFGFLERRIGARTTLYLTILVWILAIMGMHQLSQLAQISGLELVTVFLLVALLAGTGIGAIQSSSRSLVGQLTPKQYAGQAFGYWGVFMRVATLLGASFGLAADLIGLRTALLLVIGFFVVGALLLAMVPLGRTIKALALQDRTQQG